MVIKELFLKQTQKRYIIQGIIIFALFMVLYTLLDYFNDGYQVMKTEYGLYLVIINIFINVIMALTSALMMNISTAYVLFSNKEGKGTFFSAFAILFGMLTYGCTPCIISFFAVFGITVSVAVLPLAGLPYKLIALLILGIGFMWLVLEIKNFRCKVDLKTKKEDVNE